MAETPSKPETIEVVFSAETIAERIDAMAAAHRRAAASTTSSSSPCSRAASCSPPICCGRSIAPACRRRSISCRCRAIAAATTSSGPVEIVRDIEIDVAGRNVLIVDDILESGRTLAFAKDLIAARGAARVATCVLLDKPVPARGRDRRRFQGVRMSRGVCGRLRHGLGAPLARAAVRGARWCGPHASGREMRRRRRATWHASFWPRTTRRRGTWCSGRWRRTATRWS